MTLDFPSLPESAPYSAAFVAIFCTAAASATASCGRSFTSGPATRMRSEGRYGARGSLDDWRNRRSGPVTRREQVVGLRQGKQTLLKAIDVIRHAPRAGACQTGDRLDLGQHVLDAVIEFANQNVLVRKRALQVLADPAEHRLHFGKLAHPGSHHGKVAA